MTTLTGLVKIELPSPSPTLYLCDGGYVIWGSETYISQHPTFGSIGAFDMMGDGVGDEIPSAELLLMPNPAAAVGDLVKPGFQRARCRIWIAEVNPATSQVIGTPEIQFDGQLDRCVLAVGKSRRDLTMTIVSTLEVLFEGNTGNSLNPSFHKSVWPGETGEDQATGLAIDIAWGAEKPSAVAGPVGQAIFGAAGSRGGFGIPGW